MKKSILFGAMTLALVGSGIVFGQESSTSTSGSAGALAGAGFIQGSGAASYSNAGGDGGVSSIGGGFANQSGRAQSTNVSGGYVNQVPGTTTSITGSSSQFSQSTRAYSQGRNDSAGSYSYGNTGGGAIAAGAQGGFVLIGGHVVYQNTQTEVGETGGEGGGNGGTNSGPTTGPNQGDGSNNGGQDGGQGGGN